MARIYLDNAATTAVDEKVLQAMLPYFSYEFGNTSSIHSFGQTATQAVDEAREKIARYLNCLPAEIIFTSGATESNNLAVWGMVKKLPVTEKYHFITSKIEHPSILETFKKLQKLGHEVTFLNVNEIGLIDLKQLQQEIKDKTVLVSIMTVNNEVGVIQPVEQIGKIVEQSREKRGENSLPLYFHTDAVQAINYLDMDVQKIKCDFLSFSGHKIYAPKGIGVLFVRQGVKIESLLYGGHHEYGLRAGTLNTPSIVGLGKAMEMAVDERTKVSQKIKKLRGAIIDGLNEIADIRINSSDLHGVPGILNVSFLKAEGESILMMLDMDGIAISTGSACSSGALEPSHVLTAMGVPVEWTHGSVRISLSKNNTQTEVNTFLISLKKIVERLRQMAPEIK